MAFKRRNHILLSGCFVGDGASENYEIDIKIQSGFLSDNVISLTRTGDIICFQVSIYLHNYNDIRMYEGEVMNLRGFQGGIRNRTCDVR